MTAVLSRALLPLALALSVASLNAQTPSHTPANRSAAKNSLDPGLVISGTYRNKSLGLSCKIPEGWVLRTDEMNVGSRDTTTNDAADSSKPADAHASSASAKVLLAAFSRPPEAKG